MKPLRVVFGEWAPDLAPVANQGLLTAKNAIPTAAGYLPVQSLSTTGLDALPLRPQGAFSGRDEDGRAFHIVGTATKLYRFDYSGVTDVSRLVGGNYNTQTADQWHFEQFRNSVIATNGQDDIQYLDLATTNFVQLSPDAPRAKYVGYVRDILTFGHLTSDPVLGGASSNSIRSPSLGDPTDWPDPTDPGSTALANQATLSELSGNGGAIQAIITGAEVSAIFQQFAVTRAEYVGGDVVLQLDPVKRAKGLVAPRAAVAFERSVLYLAEDGWQIFDYTTSSPVGDQKINRFFLDDLDQQFLDRVTAQAHPKLPVVVVSYPGAGHMNGRPNKLLFYNYSLDRWSLAEVDCELLTRVTPFGVTLDDLTDDLDVDYPISFDNAFGAFGAGDLGGYTSGYELATFTGTSLAATLETGDQEHSPGRVSRVASVRPLCDATSPTVQVSARYDRTTAEDSIVYGSAAGLNRKGECPVRGAKGRYHRYRVNLPAGWSEQAVGVDVYSSVSGGR